MVQTALCGVTVTTLQACLAALSYDSVRHSWKKSQDVLWALVAAAVTLSSIAVVETALFGRSINLQTAAMEKDLFRMCTHSHPVKSCESEPFGLVPFALGVPLGGGDSLGASYPLTPMLVKTTSLYPAFYVLILWKRLFR